MSLKLCRSIELGRAVLLTPAASLELWLKTLITISPQQQLTDLKQHDTASLLDILSSGQAWVGRGNGLYIELEITFGHQPVDDEQLQQLSEAILCAPVWKQLSLKPSLPRGIVQSPGKLRLIINYASEGAASTEKRCHHFLSSISGTDVRPPEDVPLLSLDSVLLYADIFEVPERKNIASSKRLRTSTNNSNLLQRRPDGAFEPDVSDESPSAWPTALKRGRASAMLNVETSSSIQQGSLNIADLGTLIDGALRVSVLSRINNKMLPGVRLKANTFEVGLADIAPILWKPGYLKLLSQRVNLVPVISRSLCQAAATTATSPSSLEKLLSAATTSLPVLQTPGQRSSRECGGDLDRDYMVSSIASRLWLHLQRNTPCKSSAGLHSFVSAELSSSPHIQIDEILEELGQEYRAHRGSSRLTVDPHSGELTGCHQYLKDLSATTMTYCGSLPQQRVPKENITPDHQSKEVDDELLLGDECFAPLNNVIYHENETSYSQPHLATILSHTCGTNRSSC